MGDPTPRPPGQEDDLLDLYEHAPFGYVSTRLDWTVVRANATFGAMLGVAAADLVGRDFTSLLAVGTRIYHETHYMPLLTMQGHVDEVSAEVQTADGGRLPVLLSSVLRAADEDRAGIVRTCVVPAPDRRRFEAQVQRDRRRAEASEQRLGRLHAIVVRLARTNTVADVADAVVDLLGGEGRACLWAPWSTDVLRPVGRPGQSDQASAVPGGDAVAVRAWATGEVAADPQSDVVAVRVESDSAPIGVVSMQLGSLLPGLGQGLPDVDRDDPGARDLDAVDIALLETVAGAVAQAWERARLYERKDWLLGVAAHDLRTPLTTVMGSAETLQRTLGSSMTDLDRRLLDGILAAGRAMDALIGDVLALATIEAGQLSLSLRPVDLGALVTATVDVHRPAATAKQIVIEAAVGSLDGSAVADDVRIGQVVDNLVGNAVKYSEHGSRIRVRVVGDADRVGVEVQDEGVGIPDAELGQVFAPFHRTSVRPTAGESSTGLGLSIARSVVEAHGGSIEVASEVGVGSTFRFLLPRQPQGPPTGSGDAASS